MGDIQRRHHCLDTVCGIRLIYVIYPLLSNLNVRVLINASIIFLCLLLYSIGLFFFDAPQFVKKEEDKVGRTGLIFILFSCVLLIIHSVISQTKAVKLRALNRYGNVYNAFRYVMFTLIILGVPFAYFAWANVDTNYSL